MARCVQSVRLSLQVQQAAVTLTDYYLFPDGSVYAVNTPAGPTGMVGRTKYIIYSISLSFFLKHPSLPSFLPFLDPILLVPFVFALTLFLDCLLHPSFFSLYSLCVFMG